MGRRVLPAVILAAVLARGLPVYSQGFEELAAQAQAARDSQRSPDALAAYHRAVELKPDWREGWWYIGALSYELGRYAEARSAFSRFAGLEPRAAAARAMIGLCDFETGQWEQAVENLSHALQMGLAAQPELYVSARLHLALVLNRGGRFEESFFHLFDLAYLRPRDQSIADALGLAVLRMPFLPREVPAEKAAMVRGAGQVFALLADFRVEEARRAYQELISRHPEVREIASADPETVISGGPPGGFPVNTEVRVARADEVGLGDEDLVLGVVVRGQARAYPVNYMNGPLHEVVNDEVGGAALAATW